MGMDRLPTARLVPRDAADHAVILRSRAGAGARRVGAVASVLFKVTMTVGFCGVGLFAIGARSTYRPDYDRQFDNIRRMQESLRAMPKIDFKQYDFKQTEWNRQLEQQIRDDVAKIGRGEPAPVRPLSVHARKYLPEAPLSPSQRPDR
jgi:hypothetical protein